MKGKGRCFLECLLVLLYIDRLRVLTIIVNAIIFNSAAFLQTISERCSGADLSSCESVTAHCHIICPHRARRGPPHFCFRCVYLFLYFFIFNFERRRAEEENKVQGDILKTKNCGRKKKIKILAYSVSW